MNNKAEPNTAGEDPSALRWQALMRASVLTSTTQRLYGLIGTVDQKGQVLIILNSVIIPLALSGIKNPHFVQGAYITIATAILSIFTAIMAIYPKRRGGAKPDGSVNLFHFGDIGRMTEDEYLTRINPVYNDVEKLGREAIKDLHDISRRILLPKYKWLKASYIVFFTGNLIALLVTLFNMLMIGN